jgi:hypothetical protein
MANVDFDIKTNPKWDRLVQAFLELESAAKDWKEASANGEEIVLEVTIPEK